jgi:short-subunit dehydrogenase
MTRSDLKVVITGASSGIGRALALEYAANGAVLGLIARRADLLSQLAASLPVRSYTYAVNVTDARSLAAAGADFIARAGCPDIVIANAGVSAGTLTGEPADNLVFEEVLAVNVLGMMLTFQPFVEAMRSQRRGVLAGIASIAGFRGLPGASAYSASKAAAISYLESLRVELRGSGVSVVTICPGIRRHTFDCPQSLSNAIPDGRTRSGLKNCPGDLRAQKVFRVALADGVDWMGVAPGAAPDV